MSERTAPALARLGELLPHLESLPPSPQREELIAACAALQRAVGAFHMEAIRFRMFSVDRLLKVTADSAAARAAFDHVRHALEEAGFHTRSHTAP